MTDYQQRSDIITRQRELAMTYRHKADLLEKEGFPLCAEEYGDASRTLEASSRGIEPEGSFARVLY